MNFATFQPGCAAHGVPAAQEWAPSMGWGVHSSPAHAQDLVFDCGMHKQHMAAAEHALEQHGNLSSPQVLQHQLQQVAMSACPTNSGELGAHHHDDALRSWLHASGLPSCTALEEQIRAAAPETYED